MAAERITLNPLTEDPDNAPLEVVDRQRGLSLLEHSYGSTDFDQILASSVSVEGDASAGRHPKNRQITMKLRAAEPAPVAAAGLTNLVTNPSGEPIPGTGGAVNVAGWTAAPAFLSAAVVPTIVQDLNTLDSGDNAFQLATTASTRGMAFALGVLPAGTYTFLAYMRGAVGGEAAQLLGGTGAGPTILSPALTTAWQPAAGTFVADGVTAQFVGVRSNSASSMIFLADAFAVVAGSLVGSLVYFDGDCPGCAWLGPRHASSSQRRPTGGKLVEKIAADVERTVIKIAREGGTYRRILPQGDVITFDLIDAADTNVTDLAWMLYNRGEVDLTFTARPYGRAPEQQGSLTDDFSVDYLGAGGVYAFDAGAGTLAASGGLLVPSSTATKTLYRTDRTQADAQTTIKTTTGASVASGSVGLVLARLDANNYLLGELAPGGAATTLKIWKNDSGSLTQLATTGSFSISAATSYWVRARREGNVVTVELWTAAPTPTGIPAQTVVFTLVGADATKFGLGVAGNVGLRLLPQATDWRYDDFTIEPNVYVERTLPALRFVVPPVSLKGSAPALGRLVLTDLQGQDQFALYWGLRSRYYDSSADAALFYEAETRTALNGAATAAGTAPASGSGNNVMRSAGLTTSYAGVLSTQATGGGNHHRHVGDYTFLARVFVPATAVGTVSVALDWCDGTDFRRHNLNTAVTPPGKGAWYWVDLGQVHLTKAAAGAQGWQGRIVAKSTSGAATETIDVDCYELVPVSEGSARLSAIIQYETPTTFVARDEFDQTAGALTGKTAPVGGAWAGAGSATDLNVDATLHVASRTAVADVDLQTGRYGLSGAAASAAQFVQADVSLGDNPTSLNNTKNVYCGVLGRYVDTNNWIMAVVQLGTATVTFSPTTLLIIKRVAGTVTTLASPTVPLILLTTSGPTVLGPAATIRLVVDAAGRWVAYYGVAGAVPSLVAAGQDAVLATGGALATGKIGVYHANTGKMSPLTVAFDNFLGAAATPDAAIFAARQLELRPDRTIRDDPAGTSRPRISKPEGDYLKLPVGSREGRNLEVVAKGFRNDPLTMPDTGIDDLQAQLFVTPRYGAVPEP